MGNKEILYVLLDQYADHEAVFLTQGVNTDEKGIRDYPKYINKVVAPTNAPVTSVGGFKTLPRHTIHHQVPNIKDFRYIRGNVLVIHYKTLTNPAIKAFI